MKLLAHTIGRVLVLFFLFTAPAGAVGSLENPGSDSAQSGVAIVSGWVCDADRVVIVIDEGTEGESSFEAAYGTPRGDTIGPCGDIDNGFGGLFNMGRLSDGPHTIVAYAETDIAAGADAPLAVEELGPNAFNVTTLGAPFLRGLEGVYNVEGFPNPGDEIGLLWRQSLQAFAVIPASAEPTGHQPAEASPPADVPAAGEVVGVLENPGDDAFVSGVGIISGWVCDAESVAVVIDPGTENESVIEAAYGTPRADTEGRCGDSDNGFGILFNMNILGDGEHEIVAMVDGVALPSATAAAGEVGLPFDTSEFFVTTLGERFLRGVEGRFTLAAFPDDASGVEVEWSQASQNFVVAARKPLKGKVEAGEFAAATGIGFYEIVLRPDADHDAAVEFQTPVGGILGVAKISSDESSVQVWEFESHVGGTASLSIEVREDGTRMETRHVLVGLGRALVSMVAARADVPGNDPVAAYILETELPASVETPSVGGIRTEGGVRTAFLVVVDDGEDTATTTEQSLWWEQTGLADLLFDPGATYLVAASRDPKLSAALAERFIAIEPVHFPEEGATGLDRPATHEGAFCARVGFTSGEAAPCCDLCRMLPPEVALGFDVPVAGMPLGQAYLLACACCGLKTGVDAATLLRCIEGRRPENIWTTERCEAEKPPQFPWQTVEATDDGHGCQRRCNDAACDAHCLGPDVDPENPGRCVAGFACQCLSMSVASQCETDYGATYCGDFFQFESGPVTCVTAVCGDGKVTSSCPTNPERAEACDASSSGTGGCDTRCSDDCKSCDDCECIRGEPGCPAGELCNKNCECEGKKACGDDPVEFFLGEGNWCAPGRPAGEGWCPRGLACNADTCRCEAQGSCGDDVCDTASGEQDALGERFCPDDCPLECGDGKCNRGGGEATDGDPAYCPQDCQEVQCCVDTAGCPSEELFRCPGACCCCPAGAVCNALDIWTCGF